MKKGTYKNEEITDFRGMAGWGGGAGHLSDGETNLQDEGIADFRGVGGWVEV